MPNRSTQVILYCASGVRSAFAAKLLQDLGYTHVESANPGFTRWKDLRFPVETPANLTPEQRDRYSRHILLPEIGEKGQEKLLKARVLLLGAGGLGSPSALYLAAAGVGTLGIIDADEVDASNFGDGSCTEHRPLGMAKVESAKKTPARPEPRRQGDPVPGTAPARQHRPRKCSTRAGGVIVVA